MDDTLLLLRGDEEALSGRIATWATLPELLGALDLIARKGGVAVVKIDGARSNALPYTVVLSGGRLGEAFFRKDGANLAPLLKEALMFYFEHLKAMGDENA